MTKNFEIFRSKPTKSYDQHCLENWSLVWNPVFLRKGDTNCVWSSFISPHKNVLFPFPSLCCNDILF